jgi:5-methylcytosine-specific restriction protein A
MAKIYKPCSKPGCPELITEGRFCDKHRKEEYKKYNKYHRDPRSNSRYGRRWREIRNLYISAHPLCERCLEIGLLVPAEHVHHITPLDKGGDDDEKNLMSLCNSCHSSFTLSETNSE